METGLFVTLAIGVFVGFYVQTVIGFGGSLVALPLLLFGMELPDAISYLSIFYFFSSVFLIAKEGRNIDMKLVLKLALASVVGVVLGILVLAFSKPIVLKKALGFFILTYVAYTLFWKKRIQLSKSGVLSFGILAGFFSGVFSTGGPLYAVCVENSVKDMRIFRATMIALSALVTVTQIPVLVATGLLTFTHLKLSLYIFPVFLFAQFLGKLTFRKINGKVFKIFLITILSISGIIMLF